MFRYFHVLHDINGIYFEQIVDKIYPKELHLHRANYIVTGFKYIFT